MTQEQLAPQAKEVELEAKRQEIVTLFDGIEATSLQEEDRNSKIAISNHARFLYKGEHFGMYAFKRDNVNTGRTRGLVLGIYSGDLPIPYYPPISLNVVIETNGNVVDKNDEPIEDLERLNLGVEILRFLKEKLPLGSLDSKALEEIPAEVASVAEKIRSSEPMKFERAKCKFFEAIVPIREKAKKVRVNKSQYKNRSGRILLGTTGWVDVEKGEKEFALRYDRVDYYMNGDWTDCDEIRMREKGIDGDGKALFIDLDIRRDYNPFSGIHNSKDVRKAVATVKLLKTGLDRLKNTAS